MSQRAILAAESSDPLILDCGCILTNGFSGTHFAHCPVYETLQEALKLLQQAEGRLQTLIARAKGNA